MTSSLGTTAAIFGTLGPGLAPAERDFMREADPFGFILFARNVETPEQLQRLCGDLREAVGRDAPILVDQEGGRVQRLRSPHWRDWQPPFDTAAAAGPRAAELLGLRARIIAAELHAVGIDANCAPVADIAGPLTHPFLQNRCYGEDPARVSEIARAMADGFSAGGVLPVVKHIPGHGRSHMDTHHELPHVSATLDALRAHDFAPFKALSDLPMAMTAHIIFDAIDPIRPATQSPEMIRLIRDEIGFEGLLMSDDLNMQALSGTLAERARASIEAGCDIALHCNGEMDEMIAVAEAAGAMAAPARARAEAALRARHAPDGRSMAELLDALAGLEAALVA